MEYVKTAEVSRSSDIALSPDLRMEIQMAVDKLTGAFQKGLTKKTALYLKSRGVRGEDISKFGWGTVPKGELSKFGPETLGVLRRSGLLSDDNEFMNPGAPVYPIYLPSGALFGWQVRTWKGIYLTHGLNKFISPVYGGGERDDRFPGIIFLVEGWFDWYAIQRVLPNVFTCLSASLGQKQLRMLERYFTEVVFLYDRRFWSKRNQASAIIRNRIERSRIEPHLVDMPPTITGDDWAEAYQNTEFDIFGPCVRDVVRAYI